MDLHSGRGQQVTGGGRRDGGEVGVHIIPPSCSYALDARLKAQSATENKAARWVPLWKFWWFSVTGIDTVTESSSTAPRPIPRYAA
ncbi:MAG: hypothetical protein O6705_09560 [Actinobacteria bacterium]|nr:hypothetical protein [Actinomycetota bacterium]